MEIKWKPHLHHSILKLCCFRKYPYLEGVEFIGPCYCTEHSDEIQKRFPEQYQKICVGTSLCF